MHADEAFDPINAPPPGAQRGRVVRTREGAVAYAGSARAWPTAPTRFSDALR